MLVVVLAEGLAKVDDLAAVDAPGPHAEGDRQLPRHEHGPPPAAAIGATRAVGAARAVGDEDTALLAADADPGLDLCGIGKLLDIDLADGGRTALVAGVADLALEPRQHG